MKTTRNLIVMLAALAAVTCVGQGGKELPEGFVTVELERPAGYRNPSDAKRPNDLEWHATESGLELAAWTVEGFHYVFCAVRNPTQRPIKYPGGCGLGWWEFTNVQTRTNGTSDWIEVKILPTRDGFPRAVSGIGPVEMDLEPGTEVRPRQGLIDASYSFCVDLWEYQFPPKLPESVRVRVTSFECAFPAVEVEREMIRRGESE